MGSCASGYRRNILYLTVDSADPDKIGFYLGIAYGGFTCGNFVGPLVGGVVYQKLGYSACFYTTVILCVLDIIPLAFLSFPTPRNDFLERTTYAALIKNRKLVLLIIPQIFNGYVLGSIEAVLAKYLYDEYNLNSDSSALVFIALVIPEFIFSVIGGKLYDKFGHGYVGAPAYALSSLVIFMLAITQPLWSTIFIIAIFGGVSMVAISVILPEMSFCVQPSTYGKSYALNNLFWSIGLLAGPLVAAPLYDAFGWKGVMINGGVTLLIVVPFIISYKRPEPPADTESRIELTSLELDRA